MGDILSIQVFFDGDGKMMMWTDEQIDQWCLALQAYREDPVAKVELTGFRVLRHSVRVEILLYLTTFLEGRCTLQDFNAVFQQQTHYGWNLFGMRGVSGGMFLNKLVKNISYDVRLTQQLRAALLIPQNDQDGQYWMQALLSFLEEIIATGPISRSQLQPARLPSFLSAWWHLQNEEQWPRFAGNLRQSILHGLPLAGPAANQIELYFAFRERFLSLKESFGISAWELEHFLAWQEQQGKKQATPESGKTGQENLSNGQARRLYLQWLLAKIGAKVGCQVWIARQDHEKSWNNESFQELSIPSLPLSENGILGAQLENIAVLWLRKNEVIAAYEIDPKSTEIVTSLLSLYDFGVVCARRQLKLCLVLPKQHFEQASFALSRPFFRQHREKLRCALMGAEDLANQAEHILRWATSPTIIENLLFSPENGEG